MNILYCGDKGIDKGVLVSILSLLMNGTKQPNQYSNSQPTYHIYIMTISYDNVQPFPESTAKFLDQLVKKYHKDNFVHLIDATKTFTANPPSKNMNSYFTPCSMLRLYIDKIPTLAELDKILYLDYDVVCRQDITPFYDTNLENIEAAGVLDIYGRWFYHYHGLFKHDYMNSGVMLFNIPACLKSNMFSHTIKLCAKKRMMLADQAALNKSIKYRKLMPRKYNEQAERPRSDTVLHHFSNNFKFWPFFHVQKIKPFEIDKIHRILKIHEYDDIFNEYEKLKDNL